MTLNFQPLKAALEELDRDCFANGCIYSITAYDILNYIENELSALKPDLAAKAASLDATALAMEIADCIGNIGLLEYVEGAVRDAILNQAEFEARNNQQTPVDADRLMDALGRAGVELSDDQEG